MANELHLDYESGNTCYAIVRNSAGQVWYPVGQVFEDWAGGAGRTMANYDIALVDKTGSRYVGNMDTNIAAGKYTVQFFLQAGGAPANGDNLIASGEIEWSGSAEIFSLDDIKALQRADKKIDTAETPWVVDYLAEGSSSVLMSKTMKNTTGGNITNTNNVLGQLTKE